MRLRLELDPQMAGALLEAAVRDLRTVDMEAEVLLRRALGLPFPQPDPGIPTPDPEHREREARNAARDDPAAERGTEKEGLLEFRPSLRLPHSDRGLARRAQG